MKDNVLKVYDDAGPNGKLLGSLELTSSGNKNDVLAYLNDYPSGATTYLFNLGDMMNLGTNQGIPCALFDSEEDYPLPSPLMSTGADALGNHIGKEYFNKETYTFWITYNKANFILPHDGSKDWEAQIACAFKQ